MSASIPEVALVLCATPGCTYGLEGGRCVNGIADPTDGRCPDYPNPGAGEINGTTTSSEDITTDSLTKDGESIGGATRASFVPLSSAQALNAEGAYRVTSERQTRVVVVSGLTRTGKTTLVTNIYDRFHAGPVAGHSFAGSQTLLAFEEWCHESRDASERVNPDTKRSPLTISGEQRFLHLCVTDDQSETGLRDLLISDLHGELFERVRDSSAAAVAMTVLPRADHFVQLLDGELLLDMSRRHETAADARRILQSCITAGVLTKRSIVQIVATKWDLVSASADKVAVLAFWNAKVASLEKLVAPHVGGFEAHITSARTAVSAGGKASGVEDLMSSWVRNSLQKPAASHIEVENPIIIREFDRVGLRSVK